MLQTIWYTTGSNVVQCIMVAILSLVKKKIIWSGFIPPNYIDFLSPGLVCVHLQGKKMGYGRDSQRKQWLPDALFITQVLARTSRLLRTNKPNIQSCLQIKLNSTDFVLGRLLPPV